LGRLSLDETPASLKREECAPCACLIALPSPLPTQAGSVSGASPYVRRSQGERLRSPSWGAAGRGECTCPSAQGCTPGVTGRFLEPRFATTEHVACLYTPQ